MNKLIAAFSLLALFVSGSLVAQAQSVNPNCVVLNNDMTIGSTDATTGGQVTMLQNFLSGRGFLNVKPGTPFGTFGPQTSRGVAQFQKGHGIIATGYVGPITRSNIQTVTCAIGSVDTSTLPITTLGTGSLSLLTFTSPVSGALIVKGEKDITPDWVVSADVKTLFAGAVASIKTELIDSTGAVVGVLGNQVKLAAKNNNKIENSFIRILKGKRGREDNSVDPGQYRLRATLVYKGTDAALTTAAGHYAAESGWFSIVDPAPKSVIKLSASTTTILVSAPVVISWSATTGSTGCTFTDVASNTTVNVGATGTTTVTPLVTSTYRVACNLTSEWPFSGMTYTTETKKGITITVGAVTTTTSTIPTTSVSTYRNFATGSQSTCNSSVTAAYGSLVKSCTIGGGCSMTGGLPTATNPSANPTVWGACVPSNTTGTGTLAASLSQSSASTATGLQFSITLTSTNAASCVVTYTGPDGGGTLSNGPVNGSANFSPAVVGTYVATAVCTGSTGSTVTSSPISHIVTSSTNSTTSSTTYRNFVTSTQSSCNTLVTTTYGSLVKSCTIGGGCSMTGGLPTATNPSANPTIWGACINANAAITSISSAPSVTLSPGVTTTYGGTTTIAWSTSPATGVTCVAAGGNLAAGTTIGTSGSWVTPALYTTTQYGIKCTTNGTSLSTTKYMTVTVPRQSSDSGLKINLSASNGTIDSGKKTTIKWSVSPTEGVTCVAAGGNLAAGTTIGTTGLWETPALYTTTQYGMKCTDASGNDVYKYVTVKVRAAQSSATSNSLVLGASASNECVDLPYNFHRGNESQSVLRLQAFLTAIGYFDGGVTGFYGDKTVAAVKMFQESKGLPPTGMVYEFTRAAVKTDSCQ